MEAYFYFKAGESEHLFTYHKYGGRILGVIGKTLPEEIQATTCGTRYRPRWIARDRLVQAIDAIVARFDADKELLCCAYNVSQEIVPGMRTTGRASRGGGVSGIQLPGDSPYTYWSIWYGIAECELKKVYRPSRDVAPTVVETKDIRAWKDFPSVNMGEVRINRKRIKTQLREELLKLRDFLLQQTADTVEKYSVMSDELEEDEK